MRRKYLSRRTVLRGLGAAIGLPLLDAMIPALGFAGQDKPKTPVRMAFVYVPNGLIMDQWTPAEAGRDFVLPKILEPLQTFRDSLLVLSGLAQQNGRALGDGPGDHARASASYLTGVHPRKTGGTDIQCGISIDQLAAAALGKETPLPSLELSLDDARQAVNCDVGYSCAYTNSIAWRGPTSPMPPEVNPRLVFERLFAGADSGEDAATRARRQLYRRSLLDYVQQDTQRLKSTVSPNDQRKIDEYLFAVRDIEKRIQSAEQRTRSVEQHAKATAPAMRQPPGVPAEYGAHAQLMFDLIALAFQADQTRIATFMLGRELSMRTYPELDISEAHHGLTHHQGDAAKIAKVLKINCYHFGLFARFIEKLKSIPEGDGTLLDQVMILYGGGISDGNEHLHHDLPVLLAGSRRFRLGQHVRYPSETPLTNLFMTMLDRFGVNVESLGDSTGRLQELSGV